MRVLVGGVEFGVAAGMQAFKVEMLVIGQLRMDTDHRRDAHVRAHGGDAAKFNAEI